MRARLEHNPDPSMRVYLSAKVLVVDVFRIWLYDHEAATASFALVSARYEPGSMIPIPTNGSECGESCAPIPSSIRPSWTGCCTIATC